MRLSALARALAAALLLLTPGAAGGSGEGRAPVGLRVVVGAGMGNPAAAPLPAGG
jgi:hypothetical protein